MPLELAKSPTGAAATKKLSDQRKRILGQQLLHLDDQSVNSAGVLFLGDHSPNC